MLGTKNTKLIVRMNIMATVLVVIVLLFQNYMIIANTLAEIFMPDVENVGGNEFKMFQGENIYPESINLYSEELLFNDVSLLENLPSDGEIVTDNSVAYELITKSFENFLVMDQWGVLLDVYAGNTDIGFQKDNITGNGDFVTQVQKIQDHNSFFLNEGFALSEFEFYISGNTTALSDLLKTFINGGCRILTDDPAETKYIQWAIPATQENGGSIYNKENKIVETALYPVEAYAISEESDDYKPYDREKELELALFMDISEEGMLSSEMTYDAENRVYQIETVVSGEYLTSSGKNASLIQKLFGTSVILSNVEFLDSTYTFEIWDNGLIRNLKTNMPWKAKIEIDGFPMTLYVTGNDTNVDYYVSYSSVDCDLQSIKDTYYEDYDFSQDIVD